MNDETDVLWLRPAHGSRGPKAAYGRDDVAKTALSLADAEGIDAVSMRRIAGELGVGVASLYRYVRRKDEVYELMIDAAIGEMQPPAPTGDRRADLRTLAYELRGMALRHRWLTSLSSGRPTLGPGSLGWSERTLALFDGRDVSTDDMILVLETLNAFVRGYVLNELAEEEALRRSGLSYEERMAQLGAYGAVIVTGGRYPRVSRVMIEAESPHAEDRLERGFARGVELVLDGLAAMVAEPSRVVSKRRRRGR